MKYLLAVVLFGLCGVAGAEDKKEQPKKFELHPCEKAMLDYVNAERARYGLSAFEVDPQLQEMARQHCVWMCRSYSMTHSNMGVAENIAMGQSDAYAATVCWMNSSGHRANILNGGHRFIGLCGYQAENGQLFWCQQFSGGPLAHVAAAFGTGARAVVRAVESPIHRGRGRR